MEKLVGQPDVLYVIYIFSKLVIFTTCVLFIVPIQLAGLLPCGLLRCHIYIRKYSGLYIGLGVSNRQIVQADLPLSLASTSLLDGYVHQLKEKRKKIKYQKKKTVKKEKEVGIAPTTRRCIELVG